VIRKARLQLIFPSGPPPLLVLIIACAALVTAPAGFARAPAPLWALEYWRYVPIPIRLLSMVLFGLALAGTIGVLPYSHAPTRAWLPSRWRHWLVVPLCGLFFWLLRERTHSGDGLLKLILLEQKGLRTDPYVWKEPLDAFAAYTTYDLLRPLGYSAAETMGLLSILAGMIYVAATIAIARLLFEGGRERRLLWLGLLALGTSQLWFGHVESYSWATAIACLGVALALAHLQGRAPLWLVGLACGTAVSFHPQAAFALPALLVLIDRRQRRCDLLVLGATCALMPLAVTAALLLIGVPLPEPIGYAGDVQLFWLPAQALAPHQLWDGLMNLWLAVPGLPLLLPVALWGWTRPMVRGDRTFRYLSAVAAGLIVYNFSFQNDLPRAQDWDLYAIAGPGVALLGYYVALRHWMPRGRQGEGDAALPPLRYGLLGFCLFFSLLCAGAWIGVNHAYTLVRPDPEYPVLYERYRLLALEEQLAHADIQPDNTICAESTGDPTGCRRVTAAAFNIPPVGDNYRPAIFAHAPARVAFRLDLPPEPTFLWLSPAIDPLAWEWNGDGMVFRVLVQSHKGLDLLLHQQMSAADPEDRTWRDLYISLAAYSGESVELILETLPGPAGDATGDRGGWGMAWLMRGTVRE
jgi:hypothetical protein